MELSLTGLALPVRIVPAQPLTDEELIRFSRSNRPCAVERDEKGNLIVMSPTGSEGSAQNAEITCELFLWNREAGRGVVLDADGGVTLPDGSVRAADAAWISRAKWDALSPGQRKGYAPVCPEFVIELRSPSDSLVEMQAKMTMWMQNGVELAWLIDPFERTVTLYRPHREPECLHTLSQVVGEGPVTGFVLPLDRIFT